MGRQMFMVTIACVVGFVGPATVLGDYYDNFNDGYYERTPNDPRYDANDPYWTDPNNCVLWDIDNPDWTAQPIIVGDYLYEVAGGYFRMYATVNPMIPFAFVTAFVDDGYQDPNISESWFSDAGSHYIMGKARSNSEDANDANVAGACYTMIHGNPATWYAYSLDYEFAFRNFVILHLKGTDYVFGEERVATSPNVPDSDNGFWMILQWDTLGDNVVPGSPNDPNDPNCHWLRAAWWNGAKHDWDGQYFMEQAVKYPAWYPNDPNLHREYLPDGFNAFAAGGTVNIGLYPDIGWDNVESRWGHFTAGSAWLNLSAKDGHRGKVTIDPDIMDKDISLDANVVNQYDPNNWGDANDISEPRRYTKGTAVVLTAEAFSGQFAKWKVWGPNDANDPNYQAFTDANAVLYLTMDGDYAVKAVFKCGGSVEPFAGIVLLVLGLGVMIRRLS